MIYPTPTDASTGGGSSRSGERINETPTLQGMARKGMLDGTPSQTDPAQDLSALFQADGPTPVQGSSGGSGGVHAEGVLRQEVHGASLCQACAFAYGYVPLEGQEDAWSLLRGLWGCDDAGGPSHRRKCQEQLAREHPELVRLLSRHSPPPCAACWADGRWEDGVERVASGIPHRVDRLKSLGNAVVPQVVEFLARRVMEAKT